MSMTACSADGDDDVVLLASVSISEAEAGMTSVDQQRARVTASVHCRLRRGQRRDSARDKLLKFAPV